MKLIPIQHIISIHFTRINFRYLKYNSHCSYYKKLLEKNPNIQTFKSGPKKFHIWTPFTYVTRGGALNFDQL